MALSTPRYNERAWAIDVITEINLYCSSRSQTVQRAGGEHTVSNAQGRLFPDVLLFGDANGSVVLQGWELKMPDTSINDTELLKNAQQKAERLGLDSFLVWNVNEAALYLKDNAGIFQNPKSWPCLNIRTRRDVQPNRAVWIASLHSILDDINALLGRGLVNGAKPDSIVSDALLVEYLERFAPRLSTTIEAASLASTTFSAEIDVWWAVNAIEYPGISKTLALARVNLLNWINRFLFAHYLKKFHRAAANVETVGATTTVTDAIAIFEKISTSCDFLNVFRPAPGQQHLDGQTWAALTELNTFLTTFRLESISQESFHRVLEGALTYSRKKLAGQFSTPKPLAEFLVRISIENRLRPILDPCCGTGTIARAAFDWKHQSGIPLADSLASTWASDKFAFPLQLCSIALSHPQAMGEIVQVFQSDAFDLTQNASVSFTHPNSGATVDKPLPAFHAVVSNLPFVSSARNAQFDNAIARCASELEAEFGVSARISNRADVYVHLILQLRNMLEASGRVGVIVSNSWLGTDWGVQFRDVLDRAFKIRRVIISGKGRWFSNADVVTTILVLEKRAQVTSQSASETTDFISINSRLEDWDSLPGGVDALASSLLVSGVTPQHATKHTYRSDEIALWEQLGLGWSSFFTDLIWLRALEPSLIPANQLFDIRRGERRGWDALFYPSAGHGIEAQYIQPVLLSSSGLSHLNIAADDEAFCCSADITTLSRNNNSGARAWIRRFENATNGTGEFLPQVLAKAGHHWYEMKPTTQADFVLSMNPDKKLAIHRLNTRSFVNQRLIRFSAKSFVQADLDLCHALMNSVIGMFLIEASGFGRGLGVLDLNATKLNSRFHMLNPNLITNSQRGKILAAFGPLRKRALLNLPQELDAADRQSFDNAVLSALGQQHLRPAIYHALKQLFRIRQTAKA